jgi:hypothetical protein
VDHGTDRRFRRGSRQFFDLILGAASRYVQQVAWLTAVPEGSERSRADEFRAHDPQDPNLTLPDPGPADWLINYWRELGLCGAGFGRSVPLSWLEIDTWARMTAISLTPWEALTLRRLSDEYVAELARASSATAPPPWQDPDDLEYRRKKVRSAFKSLAAMHRSKP